MSAKPYIAAILVFLVILQLATLSSAQKACRIGVHEDIPGGLPWYFTVVFGDNRPGDTSSTRYPEAYYRLVHYLDLMRPFAVIGTGDHTGRGSKAQIDAFTASLWNISNVWVVEGNHDVGSPSSQAYWHSVVAPPMYYEDGIPGWRVVFFSTEIPWSQYSSLNSFLLEALNTSRSIILVFHRPLYPNINYNMDPRMASIVWHALSETSRVKLVLQGHWHGYLEAERRGVLFIITAGGGAPLYQRGGRHHFLVLILNPNGSFKAMPISLDEGELSIRSTGNGCVEVDNRLVGLDGKPVEVPVRIPFNVSKILVYAVLKAPPGSVEICCKALGNSVVRLESSKPLEWYVYLPTLPEARVNYTANGSSLEVNTSGFAPYTATEKCIATRTVTKTYVETETRVATSIVTEVKTSVTTITSPTTTVETITKTYTAYNNTPHTNPSGGEPGKILLALIIVALIIALSLVILLFARARTP